MSTPPTLLARRSLGLGFALVAFVSVLLHAAVPNSPPSSTPTAILPAEPRTIIDLTLKLLPIPAGTFTMGEGSDGPAPVHLVTISKPFFLGATEVTQAQWSVVMGGNPSKFKGDKLPVENVSWDDAMAFCKKLTERERTAGRLPAGYIYTLPTEAQWEYACRAGTIGRYAGDLDAMAWYDENSSRKTHPVGSKKANGWGLSDMHGNVWES
jgi:formylglycine-generating enzyme required for sulfatase activity